MAIQIGQSAPNFRADAVVGTEFKTLSLADYKGKWTVLFFYPLDFTFVCPTEIRTYNEMYPEFRKLNCEVLGISIDSKFSHKAWIERDFGGKLQIPLLADITKQISREFGVLLEDKGIALRGTFIIDPEGKVRSYTVNDNDVGRNVEETLRTVQALETGKLTPCGWKPGQQTLN